MNIIRSSDHSKLFVVRKLFNFFCNVQEEKKEDPSATAGNKPSSVKTPAASDPPADAGPPITLEQAVSYDNPAADPRKMRRIIAEDPEWTLATVPLLSELTMENIITNFPQNPILKDVGEQCLNLAFMRSVLN